MSYKDVSHDDAVSTALNDIYVRQTLENQESILLGISALLTPHCKGSANDKNGETSANVRLIKCYHNTRKLLGKE